METPTRTISVTGHASAPAVPDIATAHLSIETLAGSVEEAFAQSGRTLDALRDALHSAGVEPRDIATTDRSLRAERKWRDGHDDGLLGYVARGTVRVTLRSPARRRGRPAERHRRRRGTGPARRILARSLRPHRGPVAGP